VQHHGHSVLEKPLRHSHRVRSPSDLSALADFAASTSPTCCFSTNRPRPTTATTTPPATKIVETKPAHTQREDEDGDCDEDGDDDGDMEEDNDEYDDEDEDDEMDEDEYHEDSECGGV